MGGLRIRVGDKRLPTKEEIEPTTGATWQETWQRPPQTVPLN